MKGRKWRSSAILRWMSSEKSERYKSGESCLLRKRGGEWTDRCFLIVIFLPLEGKESIGVRVLPYSGEAGSARLIDWMRAARYSKHPRSKAARYRAVSSLTR